MVHKIIENTQVYTKIFTLDMTPDLSYFDIANAGESDFDIVGNVKTFIQKRTLRGL